MHMTYIQPMNAAQFADFLLTMEVDDAAQFAIDYCGDTPETPSEDDLFRWHYVQKTAMERFDLRYVVFFYVDELGDENPFVIPFNNYQQAPDDNDRMQIPLYVRELFVHLGVGEDGTVYVERENTDESEAGE